MPDTEWIVYCTTHKHYLVRATVSGTTWTDDKAEAQRYTKPAAGKAAKSATWLDHTPTPWAVAETEATL